MNNHIRKILLAASISRSTHCRNFSSSFKVPVFCLSFLWGWFIDDVTMISRRSTQNVLLSSTKSLVMEVPEACRRPNWSLLWWVLTQETFAAKIRREIFDSQWCYEAFVLRRALYTSHYALPERRKQSDWFSSQFAAKKNRGRKWKLLAITIIMYSPENTFDALIEILDFFSNSLLIPSKKIWSLLCSMLRWIASRCLNSIAFFPPIGSVTWAGKSVSNISTPANIDCWIFLDIFFSENMQMKNRISKAASSKRYDVRYDTIH